MNILRLIPSMSLQAGGTVTAVKETNRYLFEYGCEITTVTLDNPNQAVVKTEGTVVKMGRGIGFYGYNRKLDEWLETHIGDYDALIIEGCWQYHGVAGRKAALKAKIPYFVFTHGMLDPWFKREYPLKHLKKRIYWLFFESMILKEATAVLFTTKQEAELAKMSFSPYEVNERIVPLGISKPTFINRFDHDFFLERKKPYLLFLGRLYEKKGVDLLLEAFLSHPLHETHDLVLAGPIGNVRFKKIIDTALDSGVVFWIPMIEGDLKWNVLKHADALILPSHQENFGLVIPEALSVGTPVLTTHPVNISPIIEEYKVGYVESDTLEGTMGLLDRWSSLSVGDKQAMRERALSCFAQEFDLEETIKAFVAVLKETMHL